LLLHQNQISGDLVLVLADFGTSLPLGRMVTFSMQLTPEYWCPEMWENLKSYLTSLSPDQG
jgi:hypothetical protein